MAGETGIIPAYAGNTDSSGQTSTAWWDHPRVCGEHFSVVELSMPR